MSSLPIRWLLVGCFCFFGHTITAREITTSDFPGDATYTKDLKFKSGFPKYIQKALLDWALLDMTGKNGVKAASALDLMSKVFVSSKFKDVDNRIVLAMSGIKISSSLKYDTLYKLPKGIVVHYKANDQDVALFFQGFEPATVYEIHQEIVRSQRKTFSLFQLVMSNAWAEDDPALCGGPISKSPRRGMTNATAFQKIWGCTKGAVGGAWDASFGAAWSIAEGSVSLVIHPIETFEKASGTVQNIAAMMSDLPSAFEGLRSAFEELPDDVKWKLRCEVISAIGTTGLIAYLSVGAGSPLLLRVIAQALTKIGRALPAGSHASIKTLELAAQMTSKSNETAAVQKIISQGIEGEELVRKVKSLDDIFDAIADAFKSGDRAAQDKALGALGSVSIHDPAFFVAQTKAFNKIEAAYSTLTNLEKRKLILKELQASQKLTPAQKAAAVAYLSAQGCNLASKFHESVENNNKDSAATK